MPPKFTRASSVYPSITPLLIIALILTTGLNSAMAQKSLTPNLNSDEETSTATVTTTATLTVAPPPAVTEAPTVTVPPPTTYERPLLAIESYSASIDTISPGDQFELSVKIANKGQGTAHNIVAAFTPSELIPLGTGGVVAIGKIAPGNHGHINQNLSVSYDAYGRAFISMDMTVSYSGDDGTPYADKFTITFPVYTPYSSAPTTTPTPTTTAEPILRPQLVIGSYTTDISVLQPGLQFKLELNVQNLGNADARRVTMIFGGGSSSGGESGGTPVSGGTSGGSGDLTNFAPLGSSNIQSLGDLPTGGYLTIKQSLIVNVNTNPGAYSMKVSFSYLDERGRNFTDDQVITLLVYSLPQVSVEFYRDPGPIYAGQPIQLPIQIVNQGRKSSILGNMRVTAENAELSNNTILVGALDPGNYFPLDAMMTPNQPGPLTLTVTVDYTDDFNQPQKIVRSLQVDVIEAPVIKPGVNGPGIEGGQIETPIPMPETFLEKVWRMIRGLIGLDSGLSTQSMPGGSINGPSGVNGGSNPGVQPIPAEKPMKGP
jgi:hypothetical protein